jgi:hypothetical protein
MRRDERYELRIAIQVAMPTWELFHFVYTVNISHGGMYIPTPGLLPVGEVVTLQITPPEGEVIPVDAVVRHAHEIAGQAYAGLELLDVNEEKRRSLETLIAMGIRAARGRSDET